MTYGYTPITFEFDEIYRRMNVKDKAQYILAEQVLKDSNYFIPKDTGALETSSRIISSATQISWNTPYARRLYYGVGFNFSHDVNPNARAMWFEHAKSNYLSDWIKILRRIYS